MFALLAVGCGGWEPSADDEVAGAPGIAGSSSGGQSSKAGEGSSGAPDIGGASSGAGGKTSAGGAGDASSVGGSDIGGEGGKTSAVGGATSQAGSAGNSAAGSAGAPAELSGCADCHEERLWCAVGSSAPNGRCHECPQGWLDCDGVGPESIDDGGHPGCETFVGTGNEWKGCPKTS